MRHRIGQPPAITRLSGGTKLGLFRGMAEDLLLLLAMRHAAGSGRGALAAELQNGSTPGRLRGDPRWAPRRRDWEAAERQWVALSALDIQAVGLLDLPPAFARASPPVLLFVRGDPQLLSRSAVGIIGSRRSSQSAEAWAAARADQAARAGQLVVSGGALGIDGVAHRAAVSAGGQTLAYIGVAVDRAYPGRHRGLFREMLSRGGALVSEHPPGASTPAFEHAQRNRFIAAHAERLYIAEAAEKSGTLGTADWARRLRTEVIVSPPGVGEQRGGIEALVAAGQARVA